MDNFANRVQQIDAENNGKTCTSVEDWAIRAFSSISLLGGIDRIDDVVGEQLARLIAIAPTELMLVGTMAMHEALNNAHRIIGESN